MVRLRLVVDPSRLRRGGLRAALCSPEGVAPENETTGGSAELKFQIRSPAAASLRTICPSAVDEIKGFGVSVTGPMLGAFIVCLL